MSNEFQIVQQAVITDLTELKPGQVATRLALFNEDGTPVDLNGGGEGGPVSWDDVEDKPADFPPSSHTHAGSQVTLTGYISGAADDISPSDTVNAALAKLEARIAALEV